MRRGRTYRPFCPPPITRTVASSFANFTFSFRRSSQFLRGPSISPWRVPRCRRSYANSSWPLISQRVVYSTKSQFGFSKTKGIETHEKGEGSPVAGASDRLGESDQSSTSSFGSLVLEESLYPSESGRNNEFAGLGVALLRDVEVEDLGERSWSCGEC